MRLLNLLDIISIFSFSYFRAIPSKGNTAEIVLTVLHRNFLGVDEFLGRVALPLSNYDHNEKPKSRLNQRNALIKIFLYYFYQVASTPVQTRSKQVRLQRRAGG